MPDDLLPERSPLESKTTAGWHPIETLEKAIDHYLAERGGLKTVIAGYPWFLDWGRDSLIVARGLIAARRFADARAVLKLFGQYEDRGTLPNMIRGADTGNRDTSDAPLWFAVACSDAGGGGRRRKVSQKRLRRPHGEAGHCLHRAGLHRGHSQRSENGPGIGVDLQPVPFHLDGHELSGRKPAPGLPGRDPGPLACDAGLHGPHRQKIRAALAVLAETVQKSHDVALLAAVPGLLRRLPARSAGSGRPPRKADDHLRPNQLLAITLGAVTDAARARQILNACEELLVPGAIRSLADRSVTHALPVHFNDQLLNDPHRPYWGHYSGDEDTRRKPAYHNGTAWTWPFPSYCEAWAMTYGEQGRQTALAWLTSSFRLLESGCLGHLPEILDGDYPHTPRGCDAQAWGASEWVRVWLKLTR